MSLTIPDKLSEIIRLLNQGTFSFDNYQAELDVIRQSVQRAAEALIEAEISSQHPRLCEVKTQVAHHILSLLTSLDGLGQFDDQVLFPRYLEQFCSDWQSLEGCSQNLKSLR